MDYKNLLGAGLTEGESKVYLALLELGSSTTGPIVKKSGVAGSIIYQLLERLIEKGLVSFIIKNKTKYYQAGDPHKIIEFIDSRERLLEDQKKKFEDLMPSLLQLKNDVPINQATMFLGFRGTTTAHEHVYLKLKKGDEYYGLGIPSKQPDKYEIYWQKDHLKRIKTGIKCKLLFNKGTDKKIIVNRNSLKLCEAREMKTPMTTPAHFLIYHDTVMILLLESDTAIEMVNQQIADSFKEYFLSFWNG